LNPLYPKMLDLDLNSEQLDKSSSNIADLSPKDRWPSFQVLHKKNIRIVLRTETHLAQDKWGPRE